MSTKAATPAHTPATPSEVIHVLTPLNARTLSLSTQAKYLRCVISMYAGNTTHTPATTHELIHTLVPTHPVAQCPGQVLEVRDVHEGGGCGADPAAHEVDDQAANLGAHVPGEGQRDTVSQKDTGVCSRLGGQQQQAEVGLGGGRDTDLPKGAEMQVAKP